MVDGLDKCIRNSSPDPQQPLSSSFIGDLQKIYSLAAAVDRNSSVSPTKFLFLTRSLTKLPLGFWVDGNQPRAEYPQVKIIDKEIVPYVETMIEHDV